MVTRLPLPEACSVTLVETVVAERAGGPNALYFNGLAAEWRQRVEHYLAERGNPEAVPSWPAIMANRTRFLTLYNSPRENSSQLPILSALRERKLQFCPACGEEGTPNTLDHYLPKEAFPHFAITPANLAPMCDTCQLIKGTETLDDQGRRIFLHPYYDDFLNTQVVRLVIGRPFNAPEDFVLQPVQDLPDDLSALVQRHIDGLELQRRYGAFFRDEYMRLLRLTQEVRNAGRDICDDIPTFKRMHELRAVNVWPHIFYAAVSQDEELLDYLANGDLPAML
ncbi:5-methylcytosine-specific restriction endonuclease McrA (plasmid) [Ensifer sp. WSM1721]|uniref:hypothetical protein n=1 Tax=Ensifer sp. WSM1721 TaxID=1041159 RepID=UPI0012EB5473|nr:hypothetical protein [Ensifer sp. WSM1721]